LTLPFEGWAATLAGMRILLLAALLLSGCSVARTAVDVATIPVKIVSSGVDAATTSQSEADEKRGRQLRLLEERCRKGKALPTDDCSAVQPR